jgi:flagellar motor switch protein FliG
MKSLDPNDLRKIGGIISNVSDIPEDEIGSVLVEFSQSLQNKTGLRLEGKSFLQKTFTKALGHEKAVRVLENLNPPEEGNLEHLKWMDPHAIANMIKNEHPQIIALILSHLTPEQGSQVLMQLQDSLRGEVLQRMATLSEVPPGIMKEVSEILQNEMNRAAPSAGRKISGVKLAANLLNQIDPSAEQSIMNSISQQNPDLVEQIRKLMFVFDDLVQLDDRAVQEVLKEVSKEQLTVALKAAGEQVKNKFYKNMSERAVQILKEDMEARGPVKLSEVEKTQQEILKVVRKQIEEGKIVIGGKGGTDVLV